MSRSPPARISRLTSLSLFSLLLPVDHVNVRGFLRKPLRQSLRISQPRPLRVEQAISSSIRAIPLSQDSKMWNHPAFSLILNGIFLSDPSATHFTHGHCLLTGEALRGR
jgi:hypothetical protein